MNPDPIEVEHVYDSPISRVWEAITSYDQMRQWFFAEMTEFEPVEGFKTRFVVSCEGTDYIHLLEVTEVIAGKRIAYRWRYEGYAGDSTVSWELSEEPDGGTRLKLAHLGQETFQGDPLFTRENGIAGWSYFVDQSLPEFLNG